MARGDIAVQVRGEYDDRDIDRAIRDLKRLGGTAEKQSRGMGGLGLKGAAVAGGIAMAAGAVFDFGKDAVTAATESQQADARLGQIASQMGLVDGAYAGGVARLQEYAGALQRTIGVEDESIQAVQSKLLTFQSVGQTMNQAGGAMDRATQAAYDLASAGFGSAEGNAVQLGKALQDPVKGLAALGRSGVTFTEDQKALIKGFVESGDKASAMNTILSAVESQVGGVAGATATSGAKMKVAFSDVQETIGLALLPPLQEFMDAVTPLIDQLKGPIGDIASAFGTYLGGALKALAPLMPPLAEALGKLATLLTGALLSAITALMPAITPLLQTFGDLASRIGPLLAPLLEKLGTLIGKILDAVMPLLEPLIDLVFTILEGAMPILDIVIDLFGTLIDALKPILGVVGSLLGPIGQLVLVIFKAIEPILAPLTPLIEILANVLADILTRAIGIIVTALGGFIVAASYVAPFILRNLIKPVVDGFLTMAENVVGTAATAFSWIPGLGPKLDEAKTAINTFKTNATKAVGDAATTIETEGRKIGQGLVDQGIGLVTNPDLAAGAKDAGRDIGTSMAEGMEAGIEAGRPGVSEAAALNIMAAERRARDAAESHSPSQLFYRIGEDLTEGMKQGMSVKWPSLGAQLAQDIDGLSVQMTGKATELGANMVKGFDTAVQGFSEKLKAATDQAKQAMDSLNQYSQGVVSNVMGNLTQVNTEDAAGNALSPDQIFNQMLGGADAWQGAAASIAPFLTQLPEQVATQLYTLPPDQIHAIADYFSANPEMLARLTQRFNELGTWTNTNLGIPMADAFAKVGDTSASEMLKKAKATIAASAAEFTAFVKNKLSSTIHVNVVYHATGDIGGMRAAGGPVDAGTPYIVGERGPELMVPSVSGTIIPNSALPMMSTPSASTRGGNSYNITVQAGVGDPREIGRQVVDVIKRFERVSGPVFAAA